MHHSGNLILVTVSPRKAERMYRARILRIELHNLLPRRVAAPHHETLDLLLSVGGEVHQLDLLTDGSVLHLDNLWVLLTNLANREQENISSVDVHVDEKHCMIFSGKRSIFL